MSPTNPPASRPRRAARRGGYTLVEIMIASTLSAALMAGVLATFLMMGRSGYNAANYSIMEAESRRALETFSEEARMADNITWTSSSQVKFRVVLASGTYEVKYVYDSSTSGDTAQCFYREQVTSPSGSGQPAVGTKLILVRKVTDFAFRRYKVVNGVDYSAANDLETKQIQITLRSTRTGQTTVAATNAVLSARVVLRNKSVST